MGMNWGVLIVHYVFTSLSFYIREVNTKLEKSKFTTHVLS